MLLAPHSPNTDERMPPESAGFTEAQGALLQQWINEGASFPVTEVIPKTPAEHWSFQPVRRPVVPEVKDKAWMRNPISGLQPQSG